MSSTSSVTSSESLCAPFPFSSTVEEKVEKEEEEEETLERFDKVAEVLAVVVAPVFLHLIVVNWSGDDIARMEVEPSDTVLTGMLQIEEQLGVSVSRQRLVCDEDALEAEEVWSTYASVRDWVTIQLTTLVQEFDASSDREALIVLYLSCGGVWWAKTQSQLTS